MFPPSAPTPPIATGLLPSLQCDGGFACEKPPERPTFLLGDSLGLANEVRGKRGGEDSCDQDGNGDTGLVPAQEGANGVTPGPGGLRAIVSLLLAV